MKTRLSPLVLSLVLGLALLAAPSAIAAESAPKIESASVSAVRPTTAILKAQIDPGGLETGYEFHLEYQCGLWLDEPCPLHCGPGIPEWEACSPIVGVPLPEGQLPPSSGVESVSLNLNKVGVTLHPNTTYRYWVEAANSAGKVEGSKEFFTTPTSSAPLIESLSASNITPRNATLEARINPEGLETSYEFYLYIKGCCSEEMDQLELLAAGQLPASYESQHVTLDLSSAGWPLAADETYEFILSAENAEGTAWGALQLVTPPLPPEEPEPPVEPPEEEPGPAEEPPAEEGQGSPEEESKATEPPLHAGSPGASQGGESGPPLPAPSGGPLQGSPSPKAPPCRRPARHHHGKHHRHHRAGVGKGCHPA